MYNGIVPDEEIKRLQGFAYPQAVTEKLLDSFPVGSGNWGLLDIGCGSSDALANYVYQRDGYYFGLDVNEQMLGTLQEVLWKKVKNYTLLPYDVAERGLEIFSDNTFEVVHIRFVLMHIPDPGKRVKIIREAIRVTKSGGRVLLMEWDWSTFRHTNNPTFKPLAMSPQEQAMLDFYQQSVELARLARVDINAGHALSYLKLAGFNCSVDQRPFDDYTDELVGTEEKPGLCRMFSAIMRRLSHPSVADVNAAGFEHLVQILPELRAMFQPPALCIAELCK
jgi:ubiquinone/menaquinone biosynthesis C-methylase UbiE